MSHNWSADITVPQHKGYAGPVTNNISYSKSLKDQADRDVPDDCEACEREAKYAVKFKDPGEIVFYCTSCKQQWMTDDKVVDCEEL